VVTAVVAALVTVAAVAAAAALRLERDEGRDGADAAAEAEQAEPTPMCGDKPCGVLTSVPVGDTTIELLADIDGNSGRLRVLGPESSSVLDTALATMDVMLTQRSLVCHHDACLVRGGHEGGMVGEVFVARDGAWQAEQRPHYSDAGYLDLIQVAADSSPEVGVAHHAECEGTADQCAGEPVVVEVLTLDGESLGCSQARQSLQQLAGWPDVDLDEDELASC
jgi:hypothetical protein